MLLIFGGNDQNGPLNTLTLIDLHTWNVFTPHFPPELPSMLRRSVRLRDRESLDEARLAPSARNGHSATLIGNRLYIVGGMYVCMYVCMDGWVDIFLCVYIYIYM